MREDPAQLTANCPSRGCSTSAERGQPTPQHQPNGDQTKGMCPGAGQPTV